jgi:hypothetical protein
MRTRSRTIIVSETDEDRLQTIANAYPLVAHHRLAQVAYRFGLRAMASEPDRVVEEAAREAHHDGPSADPTGGAR